jgi:TonB family protein
MSEAPRFICRRGQLAIQEEIFEATRAVLKRELWPLIRFRFLDIWGTVVVDAVIDGHGNVVQARVVSGHPLLMDAALKAVLLWKYDPTTLNGQPVSVELQVQVHFKLNS